MVKCIKEEQSIMADSETSTTPQPMEEEKKDDGLVKEETNSSKIDTAEPEEEGKSEETPSTNEKEESKKKEEQEVQSEGETSVSSKNLEEARSSHQNVLIHFIFSPFVSANFIPRNNLVKRIF